jgi:hypothetical protein
LSATTGGTLFISLPHYNSSGEPQGSSTRQQTEKYNPKKGFDDKKALDDARGRHHVGRSQDNPADSRRQTLAGVYEKNPKKAS